MKLKSCKHTKPLANMPPTLMLAGRTLPPPNVLKVSWSKAQRFSASDNPDRTHPNLFAWQDPSFLSNKNPVVSRMRAQVEELDLTGIGVLIGGTTV